MLGQRLLEVGEPQPFEFATLPDRRSGRIATVGIEPDPHPGPKGVPHLARHLEILGHVNVAPKRSPVHPDLERFEPLRTPAEDVGDHLLG